MPPFLLPIYQAAGIEYGIRWEVLAAINEIETDYGRNLNVSSAGAVGWMQFIPSTWRMYGTDANEDGRKDPYNPVDAIFAAARYLSAAGYEDDVRRAIFAYNHADWYVDSVLLRARLIAGVPADLVGSLTGLTEGRFPVYARARYADDLAERDLRQARQDGRERGQPRGVERRPPQHRHLHPPRRAGGGGERRRDQEDRAEPQARPLHRAPGRVRQPLHLRAPRLGGRASTRSRAPTPTRSAAARAPCARTRRRTPRRARPPRRAASPTTRPATATIAVDPGLHRLAAREGAPVRAPGPPGRPRRRRPRADRGLQAEQAGRLRDLRRLLLAALRPRPVEGAPAPPARGLARDRRHRARTRRPARLGRRRAPDLLDPARRPRRAADRPEADPRRLEAARGHRDLPRLGTQRPLRLEGRLRLDRADPPLAEAAARAPRALRRAHRALRAAAATTSAPARSTGACSRRSSTSPSPACGRP